MKNRLFIVLLVLSLAALACSTQGIGSTPSDNVETVVAQTMQALTPDVSNPVDATSAPPSGTSGLLPHSLYYLNSDSAGFLQVYRLGTDGKTVQQVTFEPGNVENYAVSPTDGSVAYSSNNQLLLVNADGSNRRIVVDGGPLGSDESYMNSRIGSIAFSPDGKTVAFGFGGLNFYAIDSGAINKVLENQMETNADFSILREAYSPNVYSPDGTKLLVNIGYYEGGVYAIYHLGGNTLVRSEENAVSCCDGSWTPDSSAYYAASPYFGMISPGLWRINANGKVDELIASDFSNTPLEFAQAPALGPDGKLYYFYNTQPSPDDFVNRVPLFMVRSEINTTENWESLSAEPIADINEILWAPDTSFAILAIAPAENIHQGGVANIYKTDGSPPIQLVPFAQEMLWGP